MKAALSRPRVERCRPARLGEQPREVAVVIDVLRATSTAVVLASRGFNMTVAGTPEALASLPCPPAGWMVFSELPLAAAEGRVHVDNSPVAARDVDAAGRGVVLVTTNGTRALVAASRVARSVIAASFLNLTRTVEYLRASSFRSVTLVPAGNVARDEPRAEDELCADALESLLLGEEVDWPSLARRCRADARVERRLVAAPTFAADLDLALAYDTFPLVLELVDAREATATLRSAVP